MTTLKSECRKFSANIFNKTKCQNCFRTKEAHSAEALESNRATRKVSKCGYLFVAPDWDFTVSINRTKRWQRRWFVLYDDGELTYSVDEHPDTVPQAVIDMNKVLEVSDAEDVTGNQFAIAITAPEKVHFVKGTSREESKWWFDVLNKLPRSNMRGKHKRNATFPGGKATITPAVAIISSDQETSSEEQVHCPEVVVQRPRFLSTSETSRNLKDWWFEVNGNEEDVFPTKDFTDAAVVGSRSDVESAVISPPPSEVDLNNALNQLITSAAQLNNACPQSLQEDNAIEDVGDDEESKEKKMSLADENARRARSRRYLKRESRGLRNQRSRSDGVAKMIPSRDHHLIQDCNDDNNTLRSPKDNPVLLLLLSDQPMAAATATPQGSSETTDDVKLSPAPVRRRRHTSDNVENKSIAAPKRSVIGTKRDGTGATGILKRTALKKSESLMNIASEVSPEMRSRISELKRNYSYKGSPSMYKKKSDASQQGPASVNTANSQPFIRPVRDIDPKSPTVIQTDSTSKPAGFSPHVNHTSWEVGVDICTKDTLMKKGWLMRQTLTKEWSRHWYVLKNASLTYYRDPSAEDCGILDGILDLNQVTNIGELDSEKTFAFCLIMWDNKKHVLSAATSEVRSGWIKAIQSASNLWDSESRKDFSCDEIVLPEHSFHISNNAKASERCHPSVSSSPAATPELDKMLDLSSSDDQSEYFSIIDEEEARDDRSSSPRALPPSPPVNRNAMSLVKERARSRSSASASYSVPTRQGSFSSSGTDGSETRQEHNSDGTNSDHSSSCVPDSPVTARKSYQDPWLKLTENSSHLVGQKGASAPNNDKAPKDPKVEERGQQQKSDSSSMVDEEDCSGSVEGLSSLKGKDVNEKIFDLDTFTKLKAAYQKLMEQQRLKKVGDGCDEKTSSDVQDDSHRLKYELLKAKYIQDRMEWEKLRREKVSFLRDISSIESYAKALQKTKEVLTELKDKFCDSSGFSEDGAAAKEIQRLCENIEKLSPEKRLKRDHELKKLRKAVSEIRVRCDNLQRQLDEERGKYSSLSAEFQSKSQKLRELQQEYESLKATCVMNKLPPRHSSDQFLDDIETLRGNFQTCNSCVALNTKLDTAREQIRKLKKDLKDSHTCHDDLEIHCFKMKQDMQIQEKNHQSQIALMTARVDDLTAKFTVSERSLRQQKMKTSKLESRQERRRSSLKNKEALSLSKECEAKLFELEQKIAVIEDDLRESRHLSSQEEVLLASPDPQSEASENADSERNLRKRLSQDSSTSGSDNTGLLLRLHTLGARVKTATETAERQVQECNVLGVLDKPKICLQLRNEEVIAPDEGGEDWSSLSYATSLTDLQAIDCLDGEFPSSWSDCFECLEQKLDSLLSWLKAAVLVVQKQDSSTPDSYAGIAMVHKDAVVLSSLVTEILDSLPDIKYEDTFLTGFSVETAKFCYKSLLLHETARALQKIMCCESGVVLQKVTVGSHVFEIMRNHFQLLNNTESANVASIGKCSDLVEKLLLLSSASHESFSNGMVEDFEQVPNRLSVIERHCVQLSEAFEEAKQVQFSVLHHILADVPVQDAAVAKQKNTSFNDGFQDMDPLLSNINAMLKQFYNAAERELCEPQQHAVTLLQCEYEAYKSWSLDTCRILKSEIESITEDVKRMFPHIREQNSFSFSFSSALHKKIVFACVDLARVILLKTLTHSVLSFVSDQSDAFHSECDSKEWSSMLYKHLSGKAISLARGDMFSRNSVSGASEGLLLDHILESGAREIKMAEQLGTIHQIHQKELENLRAELEALHQEKAKNHCEPCKVNNLKLQELQDKFEQVSCCDQCHALREQLQTLQQQNDADLVALSKQHREKTEELHKHLQLVLQQKDEIHLQEVQKLEEELLAAHKRLNHLEVEYTEQIQSLRELYEQKTSMKQDPINEESVRRRYQNEIEALKGLCEDGLIAMENSYRRITMELERRHKQELSMLEAEKEKALKEETQATLTALEVMRKAHAEELQREISQFKENFLKKMQADFQSDAIHQKHQSEVEKIKREILTISEKYSVKCLESASLEERVEALSRQLQQANHQLFDLTARNKQLKVHLAVDTAQKKELLEGKENNGTMESLKLLLELKASELMQQREENAQLKQELHLAQMLMKTVSSQMNESTAEDQNLQFTVVEASCGAVQALTSPVTV